MDLANPPRRILVYGVTGSGKSTMAGSIAMALGRDWISVDDVCWLPDWIPLPDEEQRAWAAEVAAREDWILDTSYGKWLDLVLPRAQVVVALDYPRITSLWRLTRRTLGRALSGERICNGNRESLLMALGKDSIIGWHFKSFANKRRRIRKWIADPSAPEVVHLRSPKEARSWLDSLAAAQKTRDD